MTNGSRRIEVVGKRGRARSWLIPAFALAALGVSPAWSQEAAEAPVAPTLVFAFEELVTLGPTIDVGKTPYGERAIVPITGGTFTGPRIRGKVRAGGWDWQLATAGGCFLIEADYMVEAEDGTVINVLNRGRFCEASDGTERRGLTTPVFEAPIGPHDWLNGGAFVGTLEGTTIDGKPGVRIRFFEAR